MADLLTVARSQLEQGPAKYRSWYSATFRTGWTGNWAWCAAFVSWCAAHSDNPEGFQLRAYVPYMVQDAKRLGRWSRTGRPGDLVIFDWERDGVTDHVGIVETAYGDGSIVAIEGNGGPVVARYWRGATTIAGFVQLAPAGPKTVWREGDTGDKVKAIQAAVGADVDGDWGPLTTAAVKRWQAAKGLTPDGLWGPDCEAKSKATPTAPSTPAPAPTPPMEDRMYYLIRPQGRPDVWVGDLITRRWIQDQRTLMDVQHRLRTAGVSTDVQEVANPEAFGVPVGPTPPEGKS